ncbi:hypothetical protein [Streptosporangium carneum]|uniref:Uncharacterized protein n=1 Tax=Streptosporangium carneum TaxID=47481 RepID=A0A9W6I5G0_9ACTN|nr:hypothetical protein [Streptosporangium carneum]GLK11300.1 hypothetical protein GCM10017600_47060 [Streptosporangium carneum]
MRRVISAVVSVAAFGFAAALCAPAQAQSQEREQGRARDVLGGGGTVDALSVTIGGLTGGMVDGRAVLAGLDGRLARQAGSPADLTVPDGLASAWEVPVDGAPLGAPAVGSSTDGVESLLMRVSDAVEEFIGVSADKLTSDGSPTGAGIGAWSLPEDAEGLTGLADAPGGPVGPRGLDDLDSLTTTTGGTLGNAETSLEGIRGLAERRAGVNGLVDVTDQAVPRGAERAGAVAPLVGAVSPVEAAPVVRAATPLVRSASADELPPLLGTTAAEGAGAVNGAVGSAADTTAGTTGTAAK